MSKGGEWFYSKQGQQQGPVTFEELVVLAKSGELDPRGDLVWGPKMQNWEPSGDVKGLFERKKITAAVPTLAASAPAPVAAAASGGMNTGSTPYKSDDNRDSYYNEADYSGMPGVDRGGYFFGTFILPVIVGVVAGYLGQDNAMLPQALAVFAMIVSLFVTIQRFANLGMSRAWFLGFLIPLLNLWLGYRVFACPPGYAFGRKMDGIGYFLAFLYWIGFILAGAVIVVLMGGLLAGGLKDPKLKESLAPVQKQVEEYIQQMQKKEEKK